MLNIRANRTRAGGINAIAKTSFPYTKVVIFLCFNYIKSYNLHLMLAL